MNAIILDISHSTHSFIDSLLAKLDRTVNRIGYARAAAELRRLGYEKEARHCLEEMKKL